MARETLQRRRRVVGIPNYGALGLSARARRSLPFEALSRAAFIAFVIYGHWTQCTTGR